jgi:hypothetical protein
MTKSQLLEIEATDLSKNKKVLIEESLDSSLGILIRNFWSPAEVRQIYQTASSQRSDWQHFEGGLNYSTLGNPLFCHRAIKQVDDYSRNVEANDKKMAALFPDLEHKMVNGFSSLTKSHHILRRIDHSGVSVMIQTDRSEHHPHFDLNELLVMIQNRKQSSPLIATAVGMIKKPASGGRLLLWNQVYDFAKDYVSQTQAPRPGPAVVDSNEGDLVLVNGLRLHEIEACNSERMTVNLHFAKSGPDLWEYWF